jgi:SAM-dependent methyltransferase
VFRDITPARFEQLHGEACEDHWFVDSVVRDLGLEPSIGSWEALSLPGKSVLEIGPGTGHRLAAARRAGRSVTAVESSEIHRRFIRDAWGINSIYSDISDIPHDQSFEAIVALNVIEHVYDIAGFLGSIAKMLSPNGVALISTSNAASLEATLLRSWWAMCKVPDHVSIPSLVGIARAARAMDLSVERVWSSELPFEFPISMLVAARDWKRERRGASSRSNGHMAGGFAGGAGARPMARLTRFYLRSAPFDPTSRLLAALGRAGNVKVRLRLANVGG